jgi:hypothetical protein
MTRTLFEEMELIKQHCSNLPVDVLRAAHDLALDPVAEKMASNICGLIRRSNSESGFQVAYNADHAVVRQRFTIAHEIGHYMFHRDLLGAGVGDTLAYRDDGSSLPNPHIGQPEERQANTFAANMLMPNELIARLRRDGITSPKDMASRLGVSESAMRIRLGLSARPGLFD